MKEWKIIIVALCLSASAFASDWKFLGLAKDSEECRNIGRELGFERVRTSGEVLGEYTCCYGYTVTEIKASFVGPLVELAHRTLKTVDSLRPLVDPKGDYVEYLLPVKVAAERALAIAKADGPSSVRTLRAMKNLMLEIAQAEPLIDSLLRREDKSAALARELISIKEEIENRLH